MNNNQKVQRINRIIQSVPRINDLKKGVIDGTIDYIHHKIINPINKTDDTESNIISIVMTTHDRIFQTLYTLDTIRNSGDQHLQVIIVDDSVDGFISLDKLSEYPFQIDYITIDPQKKSWINPVVNYNIGFLKIIGSIVIIQNSEVCHVGDLIPYVRTHLKEGEYLCFDVLALNNFNVNTAFYQLNGDYQKIRQFIKNSTTQWYQHSIRRNFCYHFLTAIFKSDFDKLNGGFDWDLSFGASVDDIEFIERIRHVVKLKIINVISEKEQIMGIHQFHSKSKNNLAYGGELRLQNIYLVDLKTSWYKNHNTPLNLLELDIDQIKKILI